MWKNPVISELTTGFKLAERVGFEPTDGFTRQTISSRSRYDLFDTAPYEIRGRRRPENQSAAKCRKSVEIIKHRERQKREFPKSHGDFRSSAEKKSTRFRVVLVMTSSIPLHMKLWGTRADKRLITNNRLIIISAARILYHRLQKKTSFFLKNYWWILDSVYTS